MTSRSDLIVGEWERPRNIAADVHGGIHDDEAAKRLGFRGAWVSGRVHLSTFVPCLLEAFGPRWFEHGTISMDFRYGTLDQEEVRAIISKPPTGIADAQVGARLERPDGTVVAIGTVSVGDTTESSWLQRKDMHAHDAGPYELVDLIMPGDKFSDQVVTLSEEAAQRMTAGTVALPWYSSESPWGGPVASPGLMVNALGSACGGYLKEHPYRGVPIDGATELRNINGPVLVGQPYRVGGGIVARGKSPRSEYFWYESWLDDMDGRRVAEMLLQWRCVKNWSD